MDDLIRRQDAIEAMGEEPLVWLDTAEEWAEHDAWVSHVSALKALPSAESVHIETYRELYEKYVELKHASAEAVQGEWIKTVGGNGWNEWYVLKCPICGATIEDKHYHSWKYNFCPNCGADMRKEKECL